MEYYQPAGLLKRLVAFAIDFSLTATFISLLLFIFPDLSLLFVYAWLFYILLKDTLNGQSLGKLILGLKVVDVNDQTKPCNLIQSIKRNLLLLASLMIPLGAIFIAFQIQNRKDKRRWGDGFAETIVLDLNKKSKEPIKETENSSKNSVLSIIVSILVIIFLVAFGVGFQEGLIESFNNNTVEVMSDFEAEGNIYANETVKFVNPVTSGFGVTIQEIEGTEALFITQNSELLKNGELFENEMTFILIGSNDIIDHDTDNKRQEAFNESLEQFCTGLINASKEGSIEDCLYNINAFATVNKTEKVKQGWLIEKVSEVPFDDGTEECFSISLVFDGKKKFFLLIGSGNNLFKKEIEAMKKTILENTSFVD